MASEIYAANLIAEAKSALLSLLQANDTEDGFAGAEWSDAVYEAYDLCGKALEQLKTAMLVSSV